MTADQKLRLFQYKRMLEERRGYNFEYWSEKHDKMLENGWDTWVFKFVRNGFQRASEATQFISVAKKVVEDLRKDGNFARIVCGYEKNVQRIKMYTVIFKPKAKK